MSHQYPQVNVEVETWKDAAQMFELYEKNCEKQTKPFYRTVQLKLKESDTSQQLNLSNQNLNTNQVTIVVDTIKLNNSYLSGLTILDLSSNILNDEFLLGFLDSLEKMSNLKSLNLSCNQLTLKSLSHFAQLLNKTSKRLVS